MSGRRLYLTCIGSYLTGWVVAQATYNRVRKHVLERDWERYKKELAVFVADEVESRQDSNLPIDMTTARLAGLVDEKGVVTIERAAEGETAPRVVVGWYGGRGVNGFGGTTGEAIARAVIASTLQSDQ